MKYVFFLSIILSFNQFCYTDFLRYQYTAEVSQNTNLDDGFGGLITFQQGDLITGEFRVDLDVTPVYPAPWGGSVATYENALTGFSFIGDQISVYGNSEGSNVEVQDNRPLTSSSPYSDQFFGNIYSYESNAVIDSPAIGYGVTQMSFSLSTLFTSDPQALTSNALPSIIDPEDFDNDRFVTLRFVDGFLETTITSISTSIVSEGNVGAVPEPNSALSWLIGMLLLYYKRKK